MSVSKVSNPCDQVSRVHNLKRNIKAASMFPEPCTHCGVSPFIPKSRQPSRSERVGKLLKTNDEPHDAEKAALRSIIQSAPTALSEYDDKLALLETYMATLTEDRKNLLLQVEDGRKLLNPARSLPDDVLREIFTRCIPDPDDMSYSSLNSGNAPWSISQVSSRWRRVVLSSPSLWTTLSFALPKSMEPSHPDVLALTRFSYNLTLFLSRSKDFSLAVNLRCPAEVIEIHPLVFNMLQVSALRWSYLHFEARNDIMSALLEMSFERLENVAISEHYSQVSFIIRGNLRAPFLRSIRVSGNLGRVWLGLNLSLTKYECHLLRLDGTLLARLASMSALEQLIIRDFDTTTNTPQLSLPMLRFLSLTSQNPRAYSDFLPKLTAPGLQELSLTWSRASATIIFPGIPTLMRQLRSLEVATFLASKETCVDLHTWLEQAVNVTRFSLKTVDMTADLLGRLVVRGNDSKTDLLPKLELLQLNLSSGQNWDNLRSLLDSRKGRCVIELRLW